MNNKIESVYIEKENGGENRIKNLLISGWTVSSIVPVGNGSWVFLKKSFTVNAGFGQMGKGKGFQDAPMVDIDSDDAVIHRD